MRINGEPLDLPDKLIERCLDQVRNAIDSGEVANGNVQETTLLVVLSIHQLVSKHDQNPMIILGRFAKAYPALFWPLLVVLFVILTGASAVVMAELGLQWAP